MTSIKSIDKRPMRIYSNGVLVSIEILNLKTFSKTLKLLEEHALAIAKTNGDIMGFKFKLFCPMGDDPAECLVGVGYIALIGGGKLNKVAAKVKIADAKKRAIIAFNKFMEKTCPVSNP